ncbi:ctin filament organization protein app1 [Diaporthe amygdali]|uniref:ctin filament organization protein app1 n=1 Tax=Phomopsis amygdali TaxID=1214568 RepID=UPI0022FEBD66|nr:ctin filament organization protein app1 [Diaporthe amygdali]KAJ0108361.1 ctin filament organization protein app1 [Diaporthe amygdali]
METLRYSISTCNADEMQQKTRRQSKFPDVEASLQRSTPSNYKTYRPFQPKRLVSDPVANILSYLGSRNPWPQPVSKDDELWLFDNTAFVATSKGKDGKETQTWNAEFVAAVFSQHPSCTVSDVVVQIADKIGLADDDEAKRTIEERLRPFLMDIQPGKQVLALHGGETHLKFSSGSRNGISADIKTIPAAPAGMIVPTTAQVPQGTTGLLQSKTFFADPEGWAVISDVDDTIKITQTSDPIGILRSTFVNKPEPVAGMPELYKFIQSEITSASPWFYLSASPYNLYPFLRGFRDAYYPHGQLLLRDASWMSIPGLLSNLTLGTEGYKVDRMKKIHSWLPNKKVICIGDSTQSDPESYGEIYRTHPEWVKAIYIRKVTDIAAVGIEEKNMDERFQAAFKDVPTTVWRVFSEPDELYDVFRELVASKTA